VRHLGTRGEARPAGWSLHRTGPRGCMRVGLREFCYTQELTVGLNDTIAKLDRSNSANSRTPAERRRRAQTPQPRGCATQRAEWPGRAGGDARHRLKHAFKRLPPAGPPEARTVLIPGVTYMWWRTRRRVALLLVQIMLERFTLPRCASAELFFSCYDRVRAPQRMDGGAAGHSRRRRRRHKHVVARPSRSLGQRREPVEGTSR
jgi:hypothetical protein